MGVLAWSNVVVLEYGCLDASRSWPPTTSDQTVSFSSGVSAGR